MTQTDLTVVQGETKVFSAIWTVAGNPKDITGYAGHLQVRRRAGSFTAAPLIDISSEDGSDPVTIALQPSGAVGKVKVRIPGGLTALLKKTCWYDLWLINRTDTTERVRLSYGQITVSKSATDNTALVTVLIDTPDLVG